MFRGMGVIMKNRSALAGCIAALMLGLPGHAAATAQDEQVEQALGIDFRQVLCTVGGAAAGAFLGPQIGGTVTSAAESFGICPPGSTAGGSSTQFPAVAGATSVKPGMAFKVLKVSGSGEQTRVTAATPDTTYAQNEGVVLLMAYNAPGYLQIWSIDDTSETLLEGVLLSGSTASALTLPERARGGFYRFTTAGGSDKIRLRFLPCRHGSNQALEFTANAYVAAQVAQQTPPAVAAMTDQLPVCPFPEASFDPSAENDSLFRRTQVHIPVYNAGTGTHAAVLTRGGPDNATSLAVDLELKRQ